MRALIQRVKQARVEIEGKTVGSITQGLLILLGVGQNDTEGDAEWLAQKCLDLRIFGDDEGKMNRSVMDVGGGLLVVSQFTLHAKTKKGTRPSFIRAARPEQAIPLYEHFMAYLENQYLAPERGVFGGDMRLESVNDGPVSIWIDTENKE